MKYKVYIVKNGKEVGEPETFIEAEFNYGCGFDDMQEALLYIQRNGNDYIQYTILPYIYMTSLHTRRK
tara:strand:+ start:593 stop:796 length:204 start_codon:yes stop_codon:yes gene_type:complete